MIWTQHLAMEQMHQKMTKMAEEFDAMKAKLARSVDLKDIIDPCAYGVVKKEQELAEAKVCSLWRSWLWLVACTSRSF